jgi:hypothetical protein
MVEFRCVDEAGQKEIPGRGQLGGQIVGAAGGRDHEVDPGEGFHQEVSEGVGVFLAKVAFGDGAADEVLVVGQQVPRRVVPVAGRSPTSVIRRKVAWTMVSLTAGSSSRHEMPINASTAGIPEVRNGSHALLNRVLPAAMTARASSSLDPKWSYNAPLLT